jgi:hypothetical protein
MGGVDFYRTTAKGTGQSNPLLKLLLRFFSAHAPLTAIGEEQRYHLPSHLFPFRKAPICRVLDCGLPIVTRSE